MTKSEIDLRRFNSISIKTLLDFFLQILKKLFLNSHLKFKGHRIAKTSKIKAYYKATEIKKTVWDWPKDRHID